MTSKKFQSSARFPRRSHSRRSYAGGPWIDGTEESGSERSGTVGFWRFYSLRLGRQALRTESHVPESRCPAKPQRPFSVYCCKAECRVTKMGMSSRAWRNHCLVILAACVTICADMPLVSADGAGGGSDTMARRGQTTDDQRHTWNFDTDKIGEPPIGLAAATLGQGPAGAGSSGRRGCATATRDGERLAHRDDRRPEGAKLRHRVYE